MLFKNEEYNWIWEKSANVGLALIYALFVYIFLRDFMASHRPSILITVIYETMLVYFLLTRAMPIGVSTAPFDWFVAVIGTWLPLMMRPAVEYNEILVLQVLQVVGLIVSMLGLMSLNKSFGIVAANRGVKTNGVYKYIRHPLYSGYVLALGCFVVQNLNLYNLALYIGLLVFKVLRIQSEEAFLSKDKAYRDYMTSTKYRLIPFIW